MMNKKTVLLLSILFISLVSANTICDTSRIDKSWTKNQAVTSETLTCTNQINSSVIVSSMGGNFNLNPSLPFILGNLSQQVFTINFNSNATPGSSVGIISFSDGSNNIILNMTINQPTIIPQTGCQLNPSLVSYTQSIQVGTSLPIPKITFSPINCEGNIILTPSKYSRWNYNPQRTKTYFYFFSDI